MVALDGLYLYLFPCKLVESINGCYEKGELGVCEAAALPRSQPLLQVLHCLGPQREGVARR